MAKTNPKTPDVSLDESQLRADAEAEAKRELEEDMSESAKANVDSEAVLMKERFKEIAKAKYRNEIREKLEAEYKSGQEDELRKMAEAEAKVEAEQEERARLAKATSNDWKKLPEAEMRRVFRCENPPAKESYVVLMERKKIVDGTEHDALSRCVHPTHAHQYILEEGAVEYQTQLKAFRKLERQGKIKEVPPSSEGCPWIPEDQKEIQELKARLKLLESKTKGKKK